MLYKRKKIVETVVYDGEVKELPDIKLIVDSLMNHEFDVEMRIKGEIVLHPRVRITESGEDSFKYSIIGQGCSLVKRARYDEIEFMSVISNDLYSAQMKPGISRWNLLNPMADFDA